MSKEKTIFKKYADLKSEPSAGPIYQCEECKNIFSCGDYGVYCSNCGSGNVNMWSIKK
uniref:Uncharacterized protein n=1 Tax=viral metagenome TaxID=1070528 RepID=A0A6H1ZDF6_9ZZZZ